MTGPFPVRKTNLYKPRDGGCFYIEDVDICRNARTHYIYICIDMYTEAHDPKALASTSL